MKPRKPLFVTRKAIVNGAVVAVSVSLISLAGPTVANANNEDGGIETVLVTASRTPQDPGELSTSLSAVSRQDLEIVGHSHVSEVLNRIPGTWITLGNGQEHLTAIRSPSFTGPGSCGAFYIAEDGIPTRSTGFCNLNQLFDLNSEQAERIEVLRGPGTGVHGSNALHGIVNVISRAPDPEAGGNLALEAGPNDFQRVKGAINGGNDTHRWILSANGTHDGGFKNSSGYDQQKLSARYDYSGDSLELQSLLSITNLNQDTAGYIEGFNAYKDADRKDDNDDPDAYRDSLNARWYLQMSRFDESGAGWQVTPYLRYTDMVFFQHFLPGTPLEENGHKSLGLQSQFFRPLGENWLLSYGIDLELTDAELKETQFVAVGSPVFPLGKHYDYQVDSTLAAAFAGIRGQLGNTYLNADLRFEHLGYEYDNRMIDGATREDGSSCMTGGAAIPCRFSRPADRDDNFNSWSFQAGLHHSLSDQLAVTARLAHGFRAPQATELYRLQQGQSVADIGEEQLDSIELGLQGTWKNFEAGATLFYMQKDDVIFQDSNRYNISNGKTRHEGVEPG